ncbi:hypothetical protein F5Y12DRAFT_794947 [Xylaria sp. FL1777]|nr:hypothetical protein F5Y12DRAFT_794947 [Xylaria sp. FL1777]
MSPTPESAWKASRSGITMLIHKSSKFPRTSHYRQQPFGAYHTAKQSPWPIPHLKAPGLVSSTQPQHVREVSEHLSKSGILKVTLGFPDSDSLYLEQLIRSLHRYHGHKLPISHSASRGWFWDVRPSTINFQSANHQARSETMENFPWHTDCSYENATPRYFALHMLQHDRFGGGTLSLMNVRELTALLSPATRAALKRNEYEIATPPEFVKDANETRIIGSLLSTDSNGQPIMRFRDDIITPLSKGALRAFEELKQTLSTAGSQPGVILHLTAAELPRQSIIMLDNRRWLHSRNEVRDPARHLRRVRWDAIRFD